MRFPRPAALTGLAVGACFACRTGIWLRRLVIQHPPARLGVQTATHRPVTVAVPLLGEQDRVPGLVRHFARLRDLGEPVHLALITSVREHRLDGRPTTGEMCAELVEWHPDWICHHEAADVGGNMASQLNHLLADCDQVTASDVVVVYNADSEPALGSVPWAAERVRTAPDRVVAQQYGLYLRNWARIAALSGVARAVLLAAAAWQTRWSLGFERFHAGRAEREWAQQVSRPRRFNYVIGHGLGISVRLLAGVGGFSTRFPNEDAHLSVALAGRGVVVTANPFWELADSPDSVRGLLVQKRVWFAGPANAFRYARDLTIDPGLDPVLRRWSALRLFNHAVCWLGGPVAAVAGTAVPLLRGTPLPAAFALAAVTAYTALINDRALVRAAELTGNRVHQRERIEAAAGAPAAYLMHGASACWATALLAWELISGRSAGKPRTPMRADPGEPGDALR